MQEKLLSREVRNGPFFYNNGRELFVHQPVPSWFTMNNALHDDHSVGILRLGRNIKGSLVLLNSSLPHLDQENRQVVVDEWTVAKPMSFSRQARVRCCSSQ